MQKRLILPFQTVRLTMGLELIPRFCSAKEVNHRLPLTWDGTGLLRALTGTSVQFDGSLSVLLKNKTHYIKY